MSNKRVFLESCKRRAQALQWNFRGYNHVGFDNHGLALTTINQMLQPRGYNTWL